jgi:hypothetical protein
VTDPRFAATSATSSKGDETNPHRELADLWSDSLEHVKQYAVALTTAAMTMADLRRVGVSASTALSPSAFLMSSESSTDATATVRKLREQVALAFRKATREEFRDGTTSEFARELQSIVTTFGSDAIVEVRRFLVAGGLPVGLSFEALTSLAEMEHIERASAMNRATLVRWALASPSAEIRYAAAFAVAAMKDASFLPDLTNALAREQVPEVRLAFEKVKRIVLGG